MDLQVLIIKIWLLGLGLNKNLFKHHFPKIWPTSLVEMVNALTVKIDFIETSLDFASDNDSLSKGMVYKIGSVTTANEAGIKYWRAGIIPYIKVGASPLYFFMIDSKYGQLTDPGGHVNAREDWIDAALRELAEETRGIFDYRLQRHNVIDTGVAVWSEKQKTILVFLQVQTTDPYGLCRKYREDFVDGVKRSEPRKDLENSMMICIEHNDLQALAAIPLRKGDEDLQRTYDVCIHPMPGILSLFVSACHGEHITCYPHLYSRIRLALRRCLQHLIKVL